jgi:hypothetical protein
MKRFDCPACGKSLRFRLLPHVPAAGGEQIAFSCIHCNAVLTYSEAHVPLGRVLWGSRRRSVITFLGGLVLLYALEMLVGRALTMWALGIAVAAFVLAYLFSPAPAYRVAGETRGIERRLIE